MLTARFVRGGLRRARQLRRLTAEVGATVHAAGVLLAVEALIRWLPLGRLSRLFGTRLNLEPVLEVTRPMDPMGLSVRDRRRLRSARRVTDAWPLGRGTCLRRSLVAGHLIRRRRPTIRLGLVEVADDFTAHAWVEIDDRPLESIGGYAIFQQREMSTAT